MKLTKEEFQRINGETPLKMFHQGIKAKGLDEMVEHYLLEHDGYIDGLRERFANTKITIQDD